MVQTKVKPASAVKKFKTVASTPERMQTTSKLPRTFRRKAIEDSFVHFMQLTTADATQMNDVALRRYKLREIEFIDSDTFYEASAEAKFLGTIFSEQA